MDIYHSCSLNSAPMPNVVRWSTSHPVPAHTESQPVGGVDATTRTKPPDSCQLIGTGASALLPSKWKAKCLGQEGGGDSWSRKGGGGG